MVKLSTEMVIKSVGGGMKKRHEESADLFLKKLTHLHLECKGLTEANGKLLIKCTKLSVLYLFENKLTVIPDLSANKSLSCLYLQYNNIADMSPLESLSNLKKLYLGGNSISHVEGLTSLKKLEELHLEDQHLPAGEQLTFDPRSMQAVQESLHVLNISNNHLSCLSSACIDSLTVLHNLNASNNDLTDLEDTLPCFYPLTELQQIDLSGNPICSTVRYRDNVVLAAPTVEILDDKEITDTTKRFILNWDASRRAANERLALRESSANSEISVVGDARGQASEVTINGDGETLQGSMANLSMTDHGDGLDLGQGDTNTNNISSFAEAAARLFANIEQPSDPAPHSGPAPRMSSSATSSVCSSAPQSTQNSLKGSTIQQQQQPTSCYSYPALPPSKYIYRLVKKQDVVKPERSKNDTSSHFSG